jgi:hypothetical protein
VFLTLSQSKQQCFLSVPVQSRTTSAWTHDLALLGHARRVISALTWFCKRRLPLKIGYNLGFLYSSGQSALGITKLHRLSTQRLPKSRRGPSATQRTHRKNNQVCTRCGAIRVNRLFQTCAKSWLSWQGKTAGVNLYSGYAKQPGQQSRTT